MHQWIIEPLYYRLVQLGVGSFGQELHFLAQFGGKVPHDPAEFVEG